MSGCPTLAKVDREIPLIRGSGLTKQGPRAHEGGRVRAAVMLAPVRRVTVCTSEIDAYGNLHRQTSPAKNLLRGHSHRKSF
jgi:hypothetical protein